MSIKSGQSITMLFTTHDPATMLPTDATGTPTGTLYVNGTANGASVTVTNVTTGVYKAAVTLPSLTAGDICAILVAATIAGSAYVGVVWDSASDTKRVSDLQDMSAANVRTAVGLASANLDTQLADLPTNAELETALGTADDAVLAAIAALINLSAAQVNAEVVDVLRTDTLPDSYSADGAQPTMAQAILEIRQFLMERFVSGTTVTVKKPDGTTSAMTFTLSDATNPASITRAS